MISGHVDLTTTEFKAHYEEKILAAIQANHKFIVGSARGGDLMGLQCLLEHKVDPSNITVYCFNQGQDDLEVAKSFQTTYGVLTKVGYSSYTNRDKAMTDESDEDILWVRSSDECKAMYGDKYIVRISGTEHNKIRRMKKNKPSLLNRFTTSKKEV